MLIETDNIDFNMLRSAVISQENNYNIRIKNSMYGYEKDIIVTISAISAKHALVKAQKQDIYAEVTLV